MFWDRRGTAVGHLLKFNNLQVLGDLSNLSSLHQRGKKLKTGQCDEYK
jgi:hypothetical protein